MTDLVLTEKKNHILTVRINRLDRKNALTHDMYTALGDANEVSALRGGFFGFLGWGAGYRGECAGLAAIVESGRHGHDGVKPLTCHQHDKWVAVSCSANGSLLLEFLYKGD